LLVPASLVRASIFLSSSDTETSGGWLSFNVVTDNTIHTISAEKG